MSAVGGNDAICVLRHKRPRAEDEPWTGKAVGGAAWADALQVQSAGWEGSNLKNKDKLFCTYQ